MSICTVPLLGTLIINTVILPIHLFTYSCVQLTKKVCYTYEDWNTTHILWVREQYWLSQLFTHVSGVNSVSDLQYAMKKGYQKKLILPVAA